MLAALLRDFLGAIQRCIDIHIRPVPGTKIVALQRGIVFWRLAAVVPAVVVLDCVGGLVGAAGVQGGGEVGDGADGDVGGAWVVEGSEEGVVVAQTRVCCVGGEVGGVVCVGGCLGPEGEGCV